MRKFIDVSDYEGITDIRGNKCVMDGKIYDAIFSKYISFAASIPGKYLRSGAPCILFNCDMSKRIYSYEDGIPNNFYNNVLYMNESETAFNYGHKIPKEKGGGYGRLIK